MNFENTKLGISYMEPGPEQERAASQVSLSAAGEAGELALDGGIWALTRGSRAAPEDAAAISETGYNSLAEAAGMATADGAGIATETVYGTLAEAAGMAAAEGAGIAAAEAVSGAVAEAAGTAAMEAIGEAVAEGAVSTIAESIGEVISGIIGGIFDGL
ncbi:MAG: hypothetical protein FWC77_03030 [Defluviitaleaceae bacterium]|nr:hypothetical protein [Defluviitaleaceae bacterium]